MLHLRRKPELHCAPLARYVVFQQRLAADGVPPGACACFALGALVRLDREDDGLFVAQWLAAEPLHEEIDRQDEDVVEPILLVQQSLHTRQLVTRKDRRVPRDDIPAHATGRVAGRKRHARVSPDKQAFRT